MTTDTNKLPAEVLEQWTCPSCYKVGVPEAVQIRDERGQPWRDSSVQRCPQADCHHTFGGTLEDRLKYLECVYGYKYFGDYELSPEQVDAVWSAYSLAKQVPALEAENARLRADLAEMTARWEQCRESLAEQAAARADPVMPLLVPEVVQAIRDDAEAAYALAEDRADRVKAHGLSLLADWQDQVRTAIARAKGE